MEKTPPGGIQRQIPNGIVETAGNAFLTEQPTGSSPGLSTWVPSYFPCKSSTRTSPSTTAYWPSVIIPPGQPSDGALTCVQIFTQDGLLAGSPSPRVVAAAEVDSAMVDLVPPSILASAGAKSGMRREEWTSDPAETALRACSSPKNPGTAGQKDGP
jgi:hypothetical protein